MTEHTNPCAEIPDPPLDPQSLRGASPLDARYLDKYGNLLSVDAFVAIHYADSFPARSLVKELRHMGYLKEN